MAGGLISSEVEQDVIAAVISAHRKHGLLTDDPVRACAIMLREGGEAMNEALLLTVRDRSSDPVDQMNYIGALYDELAQVAATAMRIMTQIREEHILGQRT